MRHPLSPSTRQSNGGLQGSAHLPGYRLLRRASSDAALRPPFTPQPLPSEPCPPHLSSMEGPAKPSMSDEVRPNRMCTRPQALLPVLQHGEQRPLHSMWPCARIPRALSPIDRVRETNIPRHVTPGRTTSRGPQPDSDGNGVAVRRHIRRRLRVAIDESVAVNLDRLDAIRAAIHLHRLEGG